MDDHVLLECVVSVGIGVYVWCQFNCLRRDNFRADIRRLRDDLFDFMWQHELDYSTPAYNETRQTLNGLLRLSHHLSLMRFFALVHFLAKYGWHAPSPNSELQQLPDGILRTKIEGVHGAAVSRLVDFVFLEGAAGIVLRITVPILVRLVRLKSWARHNVDNVVAEAYQLGSPSPSSWHRSLLRE